MRIPKTEVAVNSRKLHSQLKLWPRLSSSALSTPVGFKSWPPKAAFILYRNNPIVYFSHLRIELNHVYSVPLGLSNRTQVCTGVLELEHTGKVDLFPGTFPDLFSSLSKDVQELSSRTHRLLEFPMQQQACFHLLSPGHLQEAGKTCAKQAIENLLRLGHWPRNPILVAQQGSF